TPLFIRKFTTMFSLEQPAGSPAAVASIEARRSPPASAPRRVNHYWEEDITLSGPAVPLRVGTEREGARSMAARTARSRASGRNGFANRSNAQPPASSD